MESNSESLEMLKLTFGIQSPNDEFEAVLKLLSGGEGKPE